MMRPIKTFRWVILDQRRLVITSARLEEVQAHTDSLGWSADRAFESEILFPVSYELAALQPCKRKPAPRSKTKFTTKDLSTAVSRPPAARIAWL